MSVSYLYISDSDVPPEVPEIVSVPDSDIVHVIRTQFGIDDARLLIQEAYLRPVLRKERMFLVSFHSITMEAQNALLKLIEEPPANAEFHIVVRHQDLLLPTLRSRLVVVGDGGREEHTVSEVGKVFFALPIKDRLAEVASRMKASDTLWAEALLRDAEHLAAEALPGDREPAQSLLRIRKYFGTRGSSSKMLLEELALSFPKIP